eukprot:scaffold1.g5228.t1
MGQCAIRSRVLDGPASGRNAELEVPERPSLDSACSSEVGASDGARLFGSLPTAVVGQIAAQLRPGALACLVLACREVRAALHVSLGSLRPAFLDAHALAAAYPNLQSLDLSGVSAAVTDATLAHAASPLTELTSLDLSGCRKLRGHGLAALARLPLRAVDLSDAVSLLDVGLSALADISSLRALTLKENDSTRRGGLQAVLAALPLEDLVVRGLHGLDNDMLRALPSSACGRSLTRLELRPSLGDVPSAEAAAVLCAGLPQLRRLALARMQAGQLDAGVLQPLTRLSALTSLELSLAAKGHPRLVASLAEALPGLQRLGLSRALALTTREADCVSALTALTSLALHYRLEESGRLDFGALSALRHLARAELGLAGVRRARAVARLLAALPAARLTCLVLREASSTAGLLEPAAAAGGEAAAAAWAGGDLRRMSRLRSLDVFVGEGVSQTLLEAVLLRGPPCLEELTLASPARPPGGAPLRLGELSRLGRLTALSLASPEGVGTDVLGALGALPLLEKVDLEVNNSPHSAGSLAQWQLDRWTLAPLTCLRRLRQIKVWNATTLSKGGLERLAALPSLRVLFLLLVPLRAEQICAALAGARRVRRLVVQGRLVVATPRALELLAPLRDLTHLSLLSWPSKSSDMWSGVLGTSKTDPYSLVSTYITPALLADFLERHPVLQHYELLQWVGCWGAQRAGGGQANSNGVFSVRRGPDGKVEVCSMFGSD